MKTIQLPKRPGHTETIRLDTPGDYRVYLENQSGEYVFEIVASGVDLMIYGLFDARSHDSFRVHTVQHHIAPASTSNLLIKGVFRDASQFHYTGMVKIEPGAQQSHAYQKNQNIVLSSDVFVESEPFLEIEANDVFCTHGSTTGRLSQDQLYYMQSRGLSKSAAEEMLIVGFLDEVREKPLQKSAKQK